tara:strand:- start:134 stop:313 length:180 start_codon:yes stop_codon:yes gene_type:complete
MVYFCFFGELFKSERPYLIFKSERPYLIIIFKSERPYLIKKGVQTLVFIELNTWGQSPT